MFVSWQNENDALTQTDLVELKGRAIIKLQNSLQAMKAKFDETEALLIKERKSAQKTIEEASTIVQVKECWRCLGLLISLYLIIYVWNKQFMYIIV